MYKRVAGTKDILPEETFYWQKIEETGRKIFFVYNYQEVRPPIIEEADLFNRSLGENTEIIQKQMFLIRHLQDTYALRPEGTASIVRVYLENNFDKTSGLVKFYYIGPMFRCERPQKGRLRQFHHLGCEVIGSENPGVDIEVISLAVRLLDAFGVLNYTLKINSLGCLKDRKELSNILEKGLEKRTDKLCADCQIRLKRNILRILDCKNEACQEVVASLDIQDKHLCAECQRHFSQVKKGLDILKIKYALAPSLVRGLDYYTRTVFEITSDKLGAQDALGAGGRYDNLVHELGGPKVGAMGFAFGIERLMLAGAAQGVKDTNKNLAYIISLGDAAKDYSLTLLDNLRKSGITADTDYEERSLKGAMRKANDLGYRYVFIIGENEIKKNVVTLKDMKSGEQKEINTKDIIKAIG